VDLVSLRCSALLGFMCRRKVQDDDGYGYGYVFVRNSLQENVLVVETPAESTGDALRDTFSLYRPYERM